MKSLFGIPVIRIACCMLLLPVVCCALATGVETTLIRKNHPWGRFRPGSWKKVRLVTEVYDPTGKLTTTSVARTQTTLTDVNAEGVTLKVEATVDVAGKNVETEPQVVTQGWHGEVASREASLSDLGDEMLTIAGQRVLCRVEQAETATPGGRIVTKSWYSDRVSPFLLKRESTTYSQETDEIVSQTKVEVVAPARSIRLMRRHRPAAELRVTHSHPGGLTRSKLWSSLDVPGGVVAQESEEFDAEGHLTRRSKLELIGYAGESQPIPVSVR